MGVRWLKRKCSRLSYCKLYKSNSFNCNKEPQGCGVWKLIEREKSASVATLWNKRLFIPLKYMKAEK
jgi:hypothetical protein